MDLIPKQLLLYWGRNRPLSFMRWLTVKSFLHHNPEWQIRIYYPTVPSTAITWPTHEQRHYKPQSPKDYFDALTDMDRVTLEAFDFATLRVPAKLPEVIKSDFLRWHLLSEYGGVWSDFDILYLRPMTFLRFPANGAVGVCMYRRLVGGRRLRRGYHSIGFLLSAPEVPFFAEVFKIAQGTLDIRNYQSAGRLALEQHYPVIPGAISVPRIFNIPFESVYPFDNPTIARIYCATEIDLPEHTVGVHWYAGNKLSAHYESTITEENYREQDGWLFHEMTLLEATCEV